MSFLSDLIQKGKDVLGFEEVPPSETEAVKRNSFDRDDYQRVVENVPNVQRDLDRLKQTVNYADDFMGDLHSALFKVDPQLRDVEEMVPSRVANHTVIEQLLDMPEVQNLRQHSTGDIYGSAMAMTALREVVTETLVQVHKATAEAAEEAERKEEERQQQAERLKQLLEDMEKNPPDPNLPPQQDPRTQQIENIIACGPGGLTPGCNGGNGGLQQVAEDAGKQAISEIRSAAKEATEKLDEEEQLMNSFGIDPGVLQRMPVKERIELAKQLQGNRLAKFAKLLGQFRMVQQAESRKRVTNAASEIHGITQGDELERMVVGEYLNFADPSLETLMLLRWTEDQLNVYDVRGKEKLGQGPIIVVCDESGSMGAEDVAGGTREAWSKALALALCDQARRRNRDFYYIGFSSYQQQHVVEFPGGVANIQKVIAMTEHFFNGGTHYEAPLRMALKLIEEKFDKQGKARPDIVFMTDDEYGSMDPDFMHEWNRVKDKTSVNCYGIAIGCGFSGALSQVSDNVRSITDMVSSDPRSVGDLFRTI